MGTAASVGSRADRQGVQCLEGKVAFTAFGKTQNLEAGNVLCLPTSDPHTVKGIENASLLLTTLLP